MTRISQNGISRNQKLVLEVLQKHKGALGAYDILDILRPMGFRAPLQVYRALDTLIGKGLIHRLESLNAFVVCSYPKCERYTLSAFAICKVCGTVTEIEDKGLMDTIERCTKAVCFISEETVVETMGYCTKCLPLIKIGASSILSPET